VERLYRKMINFVLNVEKKQNKRACLISYLLHEDKFSYFSLGDDREMGKKYLGTPLFSGYHFNYIFHIP
jgi:hypothetical protein